MTQALIHVRFNTDRLHRWATATEGREYLANMHRHQFFVTVTTAVRHDDREIEFHDLLDRAQGVFASLVPAESDLSCEMMARLLLEALEVEHKRPFEVSVWEDGECGATVQTKKSPDAEASGLDAPSGWGG